LNGLRSSFRAPGSRIPSRLSRPGFSEWPTAPIQPRTERGVYGGWLGRWRLLVPAHHLGRIQCAQPPIGSLVRAVCMSASPASSRRKFVNEICAYTTTCHRREVGAGYFDVVARRSVGGEAFTTRLHGSTQVAQFKCCVPER
jgi:hypothetical protein